MKRFRLLMLAPLLMAFQCGDDEFINIEEDLLYESGIFGTWQLSNQTIDGVTALTPTPEIILEFYADSNLDDATGDYNREEPSANIIGVFIVDRLEETITFRQSNKSDIIYGFTINENKDLMTFTYTEGDSQIEEEWIKLF